MDKVHVVEKGYTISVTSWENDGDNYATKTMVVEDKEYALAVLDLCRVVFASCNNGEGGIGNMNDGTYDGAEDVILNYIKDKPLITKGITDPEHLVNIVMDINYELMGGCEYYYSRVFDNGFISYSPVDVKCDKIAERRRGD